MRKFWEGKLNPNSGEKSKSNIFFLFDVQKVQLKPQSNKIFENL